MNRQRHLDKKHIGEHSDNLLQNFMSGALSPVQYKQVGEESPGTGGAPLEKKVTFMTETSSVNEEDSEEDDLDKLDLILKEERKEKIEEAESILIEKRLRKWLVKHGKAELLDFQDFEIKKLKECFASLDSDGSGAIGIEELEDPLIGLGLADTRQQVQDMIDIVDEDGSGQIEFDEFLGIIKNDSDESTSKINNFFKELASGHLGGGSLSFNMIV